MKKTMLMLLSLCLCILSGCAETAAAGENLPPVGSTVIETTEASARTEAEIIALFKNSPTDFVRDAAAVDAVAVTDGAFDLVGAVLHTLPDREESWVAFLDAEGNAFSTGICAKIAPEPELTYCGNGAVSLKLVSDDGTSLLFTVSISIQGDGVSYKIESAPEEP